MHRGCFLFRRTYVVWQRFKEIGRETAETECLEKSWTQNIDLMVVLCYTDRLHD